MVVNKGLRRSSRRLQSAINPDVKAEPDAGQSERTRGSKTDGTNDGDAKPMPQDKEEDEPLCQQKNQKKKWITLKEDDKLTGHKIRRKPGSDIVESTLANLQLALVRRAGDWHDKDCTCDSDWMKKELLAMGQAMREAHWWVDPSIELELIMDNAGGHGTHDADDACGHHQPAGQPLY